MQGQVQWQQHSTIFTHSGCAHTPSHTANSKSAQLQWALPVHGLVWPASSKEVYRGKLPSASGGAMFLARGNRPLFQGLTPNSRATVVNTAQTNRNQSRGTAGNSGFWRRPRSMSSEGARENPHTSPGEIMPVNPSTLASLLKCNSQTCQQVCIAASGAWQHSSDNRTLPRRGL